MKKKQNRNLIKQSVEEEVENYSSDPYTIINQFFSEGGLQEGRNDLSRLFEAAFSDALIVQKHYPSLLIFAYTRIDRLIDAAYRLFGQSANKRDQEIKVSDRQIYSMIKIFRKKIDYWNQFPDKLNPTEWVRPKQAIETFFEHKSLLQWKSNLHELLNAAVSEESIFARSSGRSKLYQDCLQLARLVDAMWVIRLTQIKSPM